MIKTRFSIDIILKRSAIITFVILSVPFIAMQFTDEVQWKLNDFIVGGILIFCTATGIRAVYRRYKNSKNLWYFIFVIVLVVLLIWMELAVGIFGSPFAGD